jgi:hypothetical protein
MDEWNNLSEYQKNEQRISLCLGLARQYLSLHNSTKHLHSAYLSQANNSMRIAEQLIAKNKRILDTQEKTIEFSFPVAA